MQVLAEAACNNRYRGFIEELKLKFGSLVAKPLHNKACVVHVANDDCANAVADVEDVSNRAGHDHLIRDLLLCAHDY